MNTILEQIGLTPNESTIYLAFLKHKEKTAAEIARILHMDKSSCYRAVDSLVEKGLLLTIPRVRGTTHTACSPEVLKELMNVKKHELEKESGLLNDFVNKLLKDTEHKRTTFIKVEKGVQAVRDSMDVSLNAAIQEDKIIKERYRLDYPYFKDKGHVAWVNEFARRRIKAGVTIQQMVNFADQDVFAPIMKTHKNLLKEIRLTPKGMDDVHALRIAGDVVTIISFDEKNDYIVITIKDKFVKELMEGLFDFIWERSEKYS